MKRELKPLAYSPEELVQVLGLGRTKIYEAIRAGKLKAVRIGRRIVIPIEAVEEFLRASQGN
ncbi:MAG TPA: helix-turn-helix domain-containing protein [Firmicutes bacterium]|nr:helix-turn-helix domain-containing protein [Bacillota bacterium]